MDKPEKISPFILDTDGQWKLRHNPKVTKPIIDMEKMWAEYRIAHVWEQYDKITYLDGANHAAKQILEYAQNHAWHEIILALENLVKEK
jgi:hypothetical protein